MKAADAVRRAVRETDPTLPVLSVKTFSQHLDANMQIFVIRTAAILFSIFGALALALAIVGVYGVKAYSVARRTREIGIRMALGARQPAVIRLIMTDILVTAVTGLAAGLAGGLVLARFVSTILFEVKPEDVRSVALPVACLLMGCLFAALPPLVRAARVDPAVALRAE